MHSNNWSSKKGLKLTFTGPPLSEGPRPALFYFALSAEESLKKDPFNQIVAALQGKEIRIFSATLPAHENNLPPENALNVWASKMAEGIPILPNFLNILKEGLSSLFDEGVIQLGKCAVCGLSRGAFIAFHLAASTLEIDTVLAFAPLTRLSDAKEFKDSLDLPEVHALDLEHEVKNLFNRRVRIYIGNDDRRVSTSHSFSFAHLLAKAAREHHIYSSPIEIIIGPSIGHLGHGTSKKTFEKGANWIKKVYDL